MTDTAKPTYAFFDNTNKNTEFLFKQDGLPDVRVSSELVHELALVTAQTNLTPRQLLERVRELEELVEDLLPYAKAAVPFPVAVGEPTVFERAEAALAKHGEVV